MAWDGLGHSLGHRRGLAGHLVELCLTAGGIPIRARGSNVRDGALYKAFEFVLY